ncbi:MAG: ABC transporter ATP-binding protein [Gemmatimonadota bacterium]
MIPVRARRQHSPPPPFTAPLSQIIASGVAVEFGATTIFRDVGFTVGRGERWGIVGRNGSGKTTLFNLVAGALAPSRGVLTRPGGMRFTLLDQHREFPPGTTVWDAAAAAFGDLVALEHSLHEQAEAMGHGEPTPEALARYDRDLERFAREGGYEMDARVDAVLQGLGFDPTAARALPVARLSGGEQGRVGLARQLAAPADLLLLDEPTNHLDLDTTRWLEGYLRGLDATVLVISHDRAFLEAVVDHVLHFEHGTATPYAGSYSHFVTQRAEARLVHERAYEQQRRHIAKEEDFIRRNIAGQKTAQAKSRRKKLARLPRLSALPGEEGVMSLALEPRQRGGNQVLVAEEVGLSVGERVLFDGFSAVLERGDVVGLVGANGTGKSTFLEAVAGARPVDRGRVRLGASIEAAYYRQDMAQVPMGKTLFDVVNDLRPMWDRGQVQGHLGRFGFSGEEVLRKADTLSGGERARVALAMLMLSRANFVLLDEPTNHLDVESVEALEDALEGFEGSVLLVSHDRALLRNLVTRVWALEEGRITDYPGTFEEWEAAAEARAVAARQDKLRAKAEQEGAQRRQGRERAAREKEGRKEVRALRRAAEEAEARVQRLEARVSDLKDALADPALYGGEAAGVQKALGLKADLARVEAELAEAIERWMEAEEALEG